MKNPIKKDKKKKITNKNSYPLNIFTIYYVLLLIFIAILAPGCEEILKKKAPAETAAKPGDSTKLVEASSKPAVSGNQLQVEAMRIIQLSLADENPLVRANAIEVVATTKQMRLMPKVQRLLQDEVVPVRFTAALAVGDLRYKLAESSIKLLFKDKDENVRIAAAYAMGKLGSPKYFEVLRKAIIRSDLTVRANTAFLMGKSGDENMLKFLYWALQHRDSDDKVRLNAVQAIATLGDEKIFPRLWAMRISAYADDRVFVIQALGAIGTDKAKNILITMLDDDVPEVRLAAAEQLGALGNSIGESEVVDVFEKNLTAGMEAQDIMRINMRVALAIGQIGAPSVKKYLPQLLKDQSKLVRIAAAKAVLQCTKAK
jgi:HEAT repeat protein